MKEEEWSEHLRGLREEIEDLRDILPAANNRSGVDSAANAERGEHDASRVGKLALVVGHTQASQGAHAGTPINQSEYPWNRDLAERAVAIANGRSVSARVFLRDRIGIAGAYAQVERWGADAAIELHFNSASPSARGTETLHGHSFAGSADWARIVQDRMVQLYDRRGIENRGLRPAPPWPRGRASVNALSSIATCLIEPFFGSNREDASLGQRKKDELAELLVDAFVAYRSSLRHQRATSGESISDGSPSNFVPSRIDIHRARLQAAGLQARAAGQAERIANPVSGCSDGWYITGYYTPIEADFGGSTVEIDISGGHGSERFPVTFLETVRMEGWGRTRHGWCLGRYSGRWHRSEFPLDALGHALDTDTVAVDPDLIPFGSQVEIPTLPPPLNSRTFVARDVGSAINAEHIDIYCGEGDSARQQTYAVTGHNHRVCV